MAGRNLFESRASSNLKTADLNKPCIFISHSSADKDKARMVAKTLQSMDVDIYFDEHDAVLQAASHSGNDIAIVKCIEDGLNHSTHLLGLITPRTVSSWWVPYEIGGAAGRRHPCGHFIDPALATLPSYIKAAEILLDQHDLATWVGQAIGQTRTLLQEQIKKSASFASIDIYVPRFRQLDSLRFT
jgi:TIR domain